MRGRGVSPSPEGTSPAAIAAGARAVRVETLPAFEDLGAAGAIVYQFPASKPGEPTVVFVVDRNADI